MPFGPFTLARRPVCRWLCRFISGLVCLAGLSSAWAIDPTLALTQLSHTTWGAEQGAPASVFSMAQTRDGLLWLGAPSGLYSFDGNRFERFEGVGGERLRTTNIESLFAARRGALWVGLRYGGAARLQDGHLQLFGPETGLPAGSSVTAFAEAPDGAMWIGTVAGLWRFDGREWRGFGPSDGLPKVWTKSMLLDRAGNLWLSQVDGLYALVRGESRFRHLQPERARGYLAEAADGSIWLSGADAALQRLVASGPTSLPSVQGAASRLMLPTGSGPVLIDRDGAMWLSDDDGVRRIRQPLQLPSDVSDLPEAHYEMISSKSMSGAKAWAMLEDREGNVWFGTSQGLDRWRAPKLTALAREPRLLGFALATLGDGDVIATDTDLPAMRLHGKTAQPMPDVPLLATASFRDSSGTLWLGTQRGVFRMRGATVVQEELPAGVYAASERGSRKLHVQAFTEAADKSLWMSVARRGIYRLADGRWQKWGGAAGVPAVAAVSLYTDRHGTTWLSFAGGEVAALASNGNARLYKAADGLIGGTVLAMKDGSSGLWLGGEVGLFHFDGTAFRQVRSVDGKGFRGVSGIVQRADGELWLNGADGLARVAGDEVNKWLRRAGSAVTCERFDFRDGLVGEAVQSYPLPSLAQAGDGRIWVATQASLASIDPAAIRRNPVAPDVLIQGVIANGERLQVAPASVSLAAGLRALQIDFTATSLNIPERVRFRYKLEGLDSDWTEATNKRQAFYTRLAPGRYRFMVTAANEDGVWSGKQAEFAFDVAPEWFETWTFRVVCALLLIGLGALVQRLRLLQLARGAQERSRERMNERQRIARELHDTLLQGMQGLVLQIQVGLLQLPTANATRSMLESALDQAESTIVEARQRVTLLRLAEQSDESICVYLERWGRELAATSSTAFAFDCDGTERPLQPAVQAEAAMIGREALFNAFRHADARHVRVRLAYSAAGFELQVQDDGRGLDPSVAQGAAHAAPGHWGIQGMRERAQELGAVLKIVSSPDGGTTIALSVTAEKAFLVA